MEKQQIFEIAEAAIKRLAEEQGANAKFPFDAVWTYAEHANEIPATQKAPAASYLKRQGFIEPTGSVTKAVTGVRRSSVTNEYKLGRYFRQTQGSASEELSIPGAIIALEKAMDAKGFIISAKEIANFYLGLLTSPLLIIAGLSGTGKSRLPRLFARSIGAGFYPISVQPQWSDNADLLGYTSALNPHQFTEGKLIRALRDASSDSSKVRIVLLDEMNLAPVEHYFSDFLSVVESRERNEANLIATDPLPLDLPRAEPGGEDQHKHLRDLRVPSNLYLIGTANMDETTRMFSPKVLDRAFTIEFSEVDLTVFPTGEKDAAPSPDLGLLATTLVDPSRPISIQEAYPLTPALFERAAALLEEIRLILRPAEISFGYRSRDAILLYLWHWQKYQMQALLPLSDAMDLCILQKVLPKVSGSGEVLLKVLGELKAWLDQTHEPYEQTGAATAGLHALGPFEKSSSKTAQMLYRLENEGATTFWMH